MIIFGLLGLGGNIFSIVVLSRFIKKIPVDAKDRFYQNQIFSIFF